MGTETVSEKQVFTCFISMPFSHDFDNIFTDGFSLINNNLSKFFLDLIRLDKQVYERRKIEDNVLKHIDKSDILIADISTYDVSLVPNVSVMHEIGYASGKDVPVILVGRINTHKNLPANLTGSFVVEYDLSVDKELKDFSARLTHQIEKVIEDVVMQKVHGNYCVPCFTERSRINIPNLIKKSKKRIYILTTNLQYTNSYLKEALIQALKSNEKNSAYKVEILTMDPESDVANARALQLGRPVRPYRNELRECLDDMIDTFKDDKRVEIVTYSLLPTQMTFIIDEIVITGIVSLGQQSREGIHFALCHLPEVSDPFIAHFRVLKTIAVAKT